MKSAGIKLLIGRRDAALFSAATFVRRLPFDIAWNGARFRLDGPIADMAYDGL